MPGELVRLNEDAFVQRDVLNIIQKIYDYDPNLKVQYLNPDRASSPGDAPYVLMERCRDGQWREVFYIWQLDERILDRLHRADMQRQNLLETIDNENAKIREEQNRRYKDQMEEARDIVAHAAASSKTTYSVPTADGGVYLLDETGPGKRLK